MGKDCEVAGLKHSLRWKAPRTKGVQIRVYAVTECLSDDIAGAMIDGWCLRESTANDIYGTLIAVLPAPDHTALPPSLLKLLAKAPASKGKVTWKSDLDVVGTGPSAYYSVVLVAFDKAGQHSPFAVADSTHLCNLIDSMECPEDSYWPPGDGE